MTRRQAKRAADEAAVEEPTKRRRLRGRKPEAQVAEPQPAEPQPAEAQAQPAEAQPADDTVPEPARLPSPPAPAPTDAAPEPQGSPPAPDHAQDEVPAPGPHGFPLPTEAAANLAAAPYMERLPAPYKAPSLHGAAAPPTAHLANGGEAAPQGDGGVGNPAGEGGTAHTAIDTLPPTQPQNLDEEEAAGGVGDADNDDQGCVPAQDVQVVAADSTVTKDKQGEAATRPTDENPVSAEEVEREEGAVHEGEVQQTNVVEELELYLGADKWVTAAITGAKRRVEGDGVDLWVKWGDGHTDVVPSGRLMGRVHCMETLIRFYESKTKSGSADRAAAAAKNGVGRGGKAGRKG